jgi:hypothetical protein
MLVNELIVLAIAGGLVSLIVSTAIMYISQKDFSFKKYTFWPSIFISGALTLVILHLFFEYYGWNAWYCKHGNACLSK